MVIFLYGEDEFRSLKKLKEIENKFLEKNSSSLVSGSFDFEEDKNISIAEIKKAFGSKGLFFEKQLVLVKNLLGFGTKEIFSKLGEFLKSQKNIFEDKDMVVVFWEKGKINEKNELFKIFKEKSKSQKFELLSGLKLNSWIVAKLEEENNKLKFSSQAIQKLVAFTGGELHVMENEIKKLASYKEQGEIKEKDVELLVREKISANIFETIEGISGGNKKVALKLLHNQIAGGEDPMYVLMMYVYQFRNFLKVGEYYEKGERNNYEIAKKVGIHPFVAQKILGQISNFPLEKLKKIYKKLQIIDEKVKTGKGEIKIELEKFILEI